MFTNARLREHIRLSKPGRSRDLSGFHRPSGRANAGVSFWRVGLMPQRFLRPGLTTSKRWNRCDWTTQSLYARLITLVDDYGRYDADPELIRSHAFPFGDPNGKVLQLTAVARMLRTLADRNLVLLYEKDGKEFLQLLRWQERARSASKYPEPTCEQMSTNDSKCLPPSPSPLVIAISHKPSSNGADRFEEFWSLYPNKQKKHDSLRAWKKIEDQADAILSGLKRWIGSKDWQKDGGQFIPHPTTFLNQRRWEDNPTQSGAETKLDREYRESMEKLRKEGVIK